MTAAINAQSQAAKETVSFIKEVGFKPKAKEEEEDFDLLLPTDTDEGYGNAEMGDVRNVTFKYEKKEANEEVKTAKLVVPILTIVPIPFLRIDEMNIDFMAKISEMIQRKDVKQSVSNYASNFSGSYRSWWSPYRAGFSASYSSRHSSTHASASRYSSEMTMNVNVRAVQDEMPAGMSKVLGILEDIIKDEEVDAAAAKKTTTTAKSTS